MDDIKKQLNMSHAKCNTLLRAAEGARVSSGRAAPAGGQHGQTRNDRSKYTGLRAN
jgi:hypothetical protein